MPCSLPCPSASIDQVVDLSCTFAVQVALQVESTLCSLQACTLMAARALTGFGALYVLLGESLAAFVQLQQFIFQSSLGSMTVQAHSIIKCFFRLWPFKLPCWH
jgi:hypothetical protein